MTEIKGKRLFCGNEGHFAWVFHLKRRVSLPALGWRVLLGCPCPMTGEGLLGPVGDMGR